MSSVTPEQRPTMSGPSTLSPSVNTTPSTFSFVDDDKTVYLQLQYGSLLSDEVQHRDVPFVPIELSKLVSGDGDGSLVDFREDWFMLDVLPRVLRSLDSFLESRGLSIELDIREMLPDSDPSFASIEMCSLMSFSTPDRPLARFNVRKLKRALANFSLDDSGATEFYILMHFHGKIERVLFVKPSKASVDGDKRSLCRRLV